MQGTREVIMGQVSCRDCLHAKQTGDYREKRNFKMWCTQGFWTDFHGNEKTYKTPFAIMKRRSLASGNCDKFNDMRVDDEA